MGPSRREILDQHELLPAPRACQELFWLRYNRQRRRWRTVHLSDAVASVVSDAAVRSAQRLGGMEQAWGQVVPAEYATASRVESFRGGRLVVTVDSASTKYMLGRHALLNALNEKVSANGDKRAGAVRQIEFRVGSLWTKGIELRREPKRGVNTQL
jgi:2-polyprenyl-6-methoxyphenol hydroxylase-like FAD-dependent oxidoreductase